MRPYGIAPKLRPVVKARARQEGRVDVPALLTDAEFWRLNDGVLTELFEISGDCMDETCSCAWKRAGYLLPTPPLTRRLFAPHLAVEDRGLEA